MILVNVSMAITHVPEHVKMQEMVVVPSVPNVLVMLLKHVAVNNLCYVIVTQLTLSRLLPLQLNFKAYSRVFIVLFLIKI